jgi:hypothetical protein
VVDGGILSIDEDADRARVLMHAGDPVAAARGSLSLVKKWARQWMPRRMQPAHVTADVTADATANAPHDRPDFPDIPDSYYCSADAVVRRATRASDGAFAGCDPQQIRAIRRRNYHDLRSRLDGAPGIALLWQDQILPDGVCPLGLPVLVDNKSDWCAALNAAGIAVSPWWEGYHRGLDWSAFPEARQLKRHLLLLPVHQQLAARHMDYIARTVASLARGRGLPQRAGGAVAAFTAG